MMRYRELSSFRQKPSRDHSQHLSDSLSEDRSEPTLRQELRKRGYLDSDLDCTLDELIGRAFSSIRPPPLQSS